MSGPGRRRAVRDGTAGLTLIEVLVALVLFALIGAAGFSVLDQILRVQSRTEGRLDHLAELQRAMHLTTRDFLQAQGGSLTFTDGVLAFRRSGGGGGLAVSFELQDETLVRSLSGSLSAAPARQALLSGVAALSWRFYAPGSGWSETWPPERGRGAGDSGGAGTLGGPGNPAAVALDVTLQGAALSGHLRRVATLPAEPKS